MLGERQSNYFYYDNWTGSITMPTTKSFYIHAGYGKAASSWLQEKLFYPNPDINFFGKTTSHYPEWLMKIHYLDELYFEKEKYTIKNHISSLHDKSENKLSLISSEPFTNFGYLSCQAKRIKELFPNPKIILVIRNPIDLIESFYKHNVKLGHFYLTIDNYLDWSDKYFALHKRPPIFLPDLFYDNIIDYFTSMFGVNNFLWLKYENFRDNPTSFISRIEKFMHVDLGYVPEMSKEKIVKGITYSEVASLRKRNFFQMIKKMGIESNESIIFENEQVISFSLRRKLNNYFAQKCTMYEFN